MRGLTNSTLYRKVIPVEQQILYEIILVQALWLALCASIRPRRSRLGVRSCFLRDRLPGGGPPRAFGERHVLWRISVFYLHVSFD